MMKLIIRESQKNVYKAMMTKIHALYHYFKVQQQFIKEQKSKKPLHPDKKSNRQHQTYLHVFFNTQILTYQRIIATAPCTISP